MFVLKSGARVKDSWVNVRYENSQQLYTYHFDSEGCMDTGWYQDSEGQWYYLVPDPGSEQGRLKIGWYFDQEAGKWYYLNQFTGGMLTDWQELGDGWYFLNPVSQPGHPYGSLYVGEITPDGYPVDENGRWIRETP